MRLLIRGDSAAQVSALAQALSARLDDLPPVADQVDQITDKQHFLLAAGPRDLKEAQAFDATLDGADHSLELVLSITDGPATTLPAPDPSNTPLDDYYAERGILRRIQGSAEPEYILAAAMRILEYHGKAGSERQTDWLPPLQPAASPESATGSDTPPPRPPATPPETDPLPANAEGSSSRWRPSAAQQGRLKRGSAVARQSGKQRKTGRKPRRF